MERKPHANLDNDTVNSEQGKAWWLVPVILVVWQGWMTLTLFGPDHPWEQLLDDQPIVSGRHPLHLYHGYLGAHSLYERGTLCCYDPSFQAGYPKTPMFDNGSRPAELFLILSGGAYRPAAYKLGLTIVCLAVPVLLLVAARGAGLAWGRTSLALVLGLLVWWGAPCQSILTAGDLDLLLAALALLAHVGLLVHFDRAPSVGGWLGLLLTGGVGWFAQPVLFALVLPLFLVYYFRVGSRHCLVWHLALVGGLGGAVALNVFWLCDWISYWWIRVPLSLEAGLLSPQTLGTLWEAALWGTEADRAAAVGLIVLAGLGVWHLNHLHQRQAARFFGLGMAGFLTLAILGAAWEPLGQLGTTRLLGAVLLFAAIPAAHFLVEAGSCFIRWSGGVWKGALLAAGLLLAIGLVALDPVMTYAARCIGASPLRIGLGPEREALVAALQQHTTAEARILWEDRPDSEVSPCWTPLLPLLTQRSYLGGLDPRAGIEHTQANSFQDQLLAGRLISDWSDGELDDFCRRYNVGWIVCWSSLAEKRFRAWQGARLVTSLQEEGPRHLFAVERTASFALKGSRVEWLHADCQHIALGDVVPNEKGEAVLSLHYQAGMQVSPSRVRLERELDPHDPIPFVRLRLPGPVTRVTLTWEKR